MLNQEQYKEHISTMTDEELKQEMIELNKEIGRVAKAVASEEKNGMAFMIEPSFKERLLIFSQYYEILSLVLKEKGL